MTRRGQGMPPAAGHNPALLWVVGVLLAVVVCVAACYPLEFFTALAVVSLGLFLLMVLHMIIYYWVLGNRPVDPICVAFAVITAACAAVAIRIMFG